MPARKTREVPRDKPPFSFGRAKGAEVEGSARAPRAAARGRSEREKMTQEALGEFIKMGIRRGQ